MGVENRDSAELGSKITRIHQTTELSAVRPQPLSRVVGKAFSARTPQCVKKRRKKTEEAGARAARGGPQGKQGSAGGRSGEGVAVWHWFAPCDVERARAITKGRPLLFSLQESARGS